MLQPSPLGCSGGAGGSVGAGLVQEMLFQKPAQLLNESAEERSRVGSKEALGSALGSWAELTDDFRSSVVVWVLKQSASLMLYSCGTMALSSCCALLRAAVIPMLMCVRVWISAFSPS